MDPTLSVEDEQDEREPRGLTKLFARLGETLRQRMGPAAPALPSITFAIAWLYLNAFVGSTWPLGPSSFPGYLLPSIEVLVVLGAVCAIAWLGRKPRGGLYLLAAVGLLLLRLVRSADAVVTEYLDRSFRPFFDIGLVWELFILLDDTIDRLTLVGYMVVSALVLGGLVFLARQGLMVAHNYFADRKHRVMFLGVAGLLLLLGLVTSGGPFQEPPAAQAIADLARYLDEDDEATRRDVAAAQRRMREAPHGLERLGERDVYLFYVSSYGRVLLQEPDYRAHLSPVWAETEQALEEDGYHVRSHLLASPARRGLPWLAQTTFATGVRVESQAEFEIVLDALASEPSTLAGYVRQAGWRTVRALPGETRERPELELPGYGMRYRAWELGYLGEPYGRIPMPDQFVLGRIHEREVEPSDEPVFVEHVTCAVQPPYAVVPPYVDDWSTLGSGEVFRDLSPTRFETDWGALELAAPAWLEALEYELTVIGAYLTGVLPDEAPRRRRGRRRRGRAPAQGEPLVIIVGDHQPPGPLARDAETDAVLVHVISRDEDLLEPFEARGYSAGLVPAQEPPYEGMETFLPHFLEDFSDPADAEP